LRWISMAVGNGCERFIADPSTDGGIVQSGGTYS